MVTKITPMLAALEAIVHQGATWPNPCVGCALTDAAGTILTTACSAPGGRPHAEIIALGHTPHPHTAYATLQPCNHTSPHKPVSCTDALISAGVREVYIGIIDPDPRMRGQSIKKLRAAGITVHVGEQAASCYHAHRAHITRAQLQRPYTTLKLAHSRDGFIARTGERTAITGPESWAATFALRRTADAVLVGLSTALTDDPQLTDRAPGAAHQPVRIVADTHARLPVTSALARTARETPVWLLTAQTSSPLEAAGIRLITCPMNGNHIDLRAGLRLLAREGLGHILIEGGAQLADTVGKQALIDEAHFIEGALTLGNGTPMPAIKGLTLRGEAAIGADIWRTYDSIAALNARDELLTKMKSL